MKVGKSYKRNEITEQYDAIVIGSGIGGLSTAALLSKEGKKVLVLEKHYVAGGFTHVFKRKDYEWDVGIHYIGEVNKPHAILTRIFSDISDGELKWADMGDVYDRIIFGDEEYKLVKGLGNFSERLKEYFPSEENAIDEYIRMVNEATKATRSFFTEKALPPLVASLTGGFMKSKFLKYSDKTTLEVLQGLTKNEKLIAVLSGQYGDYGLPPAQSSFAMHAMVVKHYFNGGAYPVGGSQRLAETIYPVIQKSGGEIYVNAGVEEILVQNGKAIGVRMEGGHEIMAPIIVSNAGVVNTYGNLVNDEVANKLGLRDNLKKVTPSVAHVCLYIGLKESGKSLDTGKANLWIYPHYDHDKAVKDYLDDPSKPFPVVYVSFPSAKDPDWENRYPGKSTVEAISLAPYEWFADWEDTRWKKRGEDYDKLKEEYCQRLLEVIYKYVPQLKGKIDYYELSSPLSTKNFTSYEKGEIYGIDHTPDRFRQKFLRPRTPIKNLYLTGQDVVTAGIGGALFGGILAASAILNKNVIADVLKRTNLEHA